MATIQTINSARNETPPAASTECYLTTLMKKVGAAIVTFFTFVILKIAAGCTWLSTSLANCCRRAPGQTTSVEPSPVNAPKPTIPPEFGGPGRKIPPHLEDVYNGIMKDALAKIEADKVKMRKKLETPEPGDPKLVADIDISHLKIDEMELPFKIPFDSKELIKYICRYFEGIKLDEITKGSCKDAYWGDPSGDSRAFNRSVGVSGDLQPCVLVPNYRIEFTYKDSVYHIYTTREGIPDGLYSEGKLLAINKSLAAMRARYGL